MSKKSIVNDKLAEIEAHEMIGEIRSHTRLENFEKYYSKNSNY